MKTRPVGAALIHGDVWMDIDEINRRSSRLCVRVYNVYSITTYSYYKIEPTKIRNIFALSDSQYKSDMSLPLPYFR